MAVYKLFLGGQGGVLGVPTINGPAADVTAFQIQDIGGNVIHNFPPPYAVDIGGVPSGNYGLPVRWASAAYSFAVNGGAVSTIGLTGLLGIPSGSTILGGVLRVVTPLTSGTSTAQVALRCESAGDLLAAAVISGAPWSTTGYKALIPIFTAATYIRTTAARDLSAVITVEALTAGAFNLAICYLPFS